MPAAKGSACTPLGPKLWALGLTPPVLIRDNLETSRLIKFLDRPTFGGLRTDELPSHGFLVYNMVHKLEGGSGGPTRVIAILDSTNRATSTASELLLIVVLTCIVFGQHE